MTSSATGMQPGAMPRSRVPPGRPGSREWPGRPSPGKAVSALRCGARRVRSARRGWRRASCSSPWPLSTPSCRATRWHPILVCPAVGFNFIRGPSAAPELEAQVRERSRLQGPGQVTLLTRGDSGGLIEGMVRMRRRQGLAVLVALVLMASGVSRGLCFMPGTGEPGPRDAHACCKKGWTAGAPGCCMAGAADEDPARTVVSVALAAPPAVLDAVVHPPPATPSSVALDASNRSHSPPGRPPLRI